MRWIEVARLWQQGDLGIWDTCYYEFPGEYGETNPTQEEITKVVLEAGLLGSEDFVTACFYSEVQPDGYAFFNGKEEDDGID